MHRLILAFCAATGACASEPPAMASAEAGPQTCALTIRFGSYAMGIDTAAAERIYRLLSSDRAVAQLDRRAWGREGEFDLCVQARSAGDAARLFEQIRPLLPAKPRGPISVSLADGRSYQAPQS